MDFIQDLTFESASLEIFGRMLPVALEITKSRFLFVSPRELIREYPSESTAYMMSFLNRAPYSFGWTPPDQRGPNHYLRICRLHPSAMTHPFEGVTAFDSVEEGTERVLALLRAADLQGFDQETGEGPFRGCDGLVRIGYRMHAPWDGLVISLCHIYVPK